MFLDVDDILLPDIAGAVAAAFARDPGVAKVQFRMALADATGTPLGLVVPGPVRPRWQRVQRGAGRGQAVPRPPLPPQRQGPGSRRASVSS